MASLGLDSIPTVLCIKGTKHNPQYSLYIGRRMTMGGWNLSASKWENPYPVKKYGIEQSLYLYEQHIRNTPYLIDSLHELAYHKLGCWCAPEPCHGNVLQKLYAEYVLNQN